MKTDRELLELAAKAAGLDFEWCDVWGGMARKLGIIDGFDWETYWNPLLVDGDALRLAVKLNMSICFTLGAAAPPFGTVMAGYSPWENNAPIAHERYNTPGEKMAATRLTIVRAAATIGESMP